MGVARGISFTLSVITESLYGDSQQVIVDVCFVCLCASQRAGAAEEELRHRHRQEEAGGRVCCEDLHSTCKRSYS